MSIEILAEAASCLLPGRVLTGLRDLRAHRWLALDETPQTLEVSARRLDGDGGLERVLAQLGGVDGDGAPGDPIVEATMLLGDHFPPPPASSAAVQDGRPSRLKPDELYEEAMFHQPLWRGVRSVDAVAPGGAHAQLQALPRTGLLRGNPEPCFVLDPVVLDCAGQVVGFWAAEALEQAKVVFPFRLAALDLYGAAPREGERLSCRAAISVESEHVVSSNIDVLDGEGRCIMRLTGWADKRFAVPERFAPLAHPARLAPISTPWQAPLAPYPDHAIACRRLDAQLPADRALWKPVWACRVLGRRERELFASLDLPETRQLEWLAARTAAKECVAELVSAAHGLDLLHAEIEILPDEQGAPVVVCPALEGLCAPAVSLAHTHGHAAALVAIGTPGAGLGIDIENLVPRAQGFAEVALTEAERRLLEPLPADRTEEWLLRVWCAREAAGKALGTGLTGDDGAPRASALDLGSETLLVDAAGRRLLARTHREQELIFATAVDRGPASEEEAR
jgi:phosphopantetheinyl transferase (holo-ACP synthase)